MTTTQGRVSPGSGDAALAEPGDFSVDIKKRKLEMDFVLEGDRDSMHVLIAVSPAFTCGLPFAEYVCERIQTILN